MKDNNGDRLRTSEWEQVRKEVMKRDGFKCRKCGETGSLAVHHIIPFRKSRDDSPENLMTVCGSCHTTLENTYRKLGPTNFMWKYRTQNQLMGEKT